MLVKHLLVRHHLDGRFNGRDAAHEPKALLRGERVAVLAISPLPNCTTLSVMTSKPRCTTKNLSASSAENFLMTSKPSALKEGRWPR